MNMTGEDLTELMMSMSSGQGASYDGNLTTLAMWILPSHLH